MKKSDQLAEFVRDSLRLGKDRKQIAGALKTAGWATNEVDEALNAWADDEFEVPIPRPRPSVSAKEAFIYGLMFTALAMAAWHLASLSFHLIDRWFPDPLEAINEHLVGYRVQRMRWSVAALIVFGPLFYFLNLKITRATDNDPGKRRSAVRKWFGYITLFLAAISLLGDALWIIYSFLNGDLGIRVISKGLVVLMIAGVIFLYFRNETGADENAA